ncbi:MAG: NUDIX hydrolase [Burkholderiales bacterium]|nr:NUDIX hydrolase [Burkholderiales bacterium]
MKYCDRCGGTLEYKIPADDTRNRYVCTVCDKVHYENPRVIVGTLPVWENKILLCQRAIEPRYGKWTLPAGFYEIGESLEEGAARETFEEARAHIVIDHLFSVISMPEIGQVHMIFLSRLTEPTFSAGEESLDVRLFSEAEIPWEEISFRTVSRTLRLFFEDRQRNHYTLHLSSLARNQ